MPDTSNVQATRRVVERASDAYLLGRVFAGGDQHGPLHRKREQPPDVAPHLATRDVVLHVAQAEIALE
jgi:hypothetical protein